MGISRYINSAHLAAYVRGQSRYPYKPLDVIQRDQTRRVRSMIRHAYDTVPYYRETMDRIGLRPSDFRDADDLAKLPILEREQLQKNPDHFVSAAVNLNDCLTLRTGGSTGEPCQVYHNLNSLLQTMAHVERDRGIIASLAGKRFGYRETVIGPEVPPMRNKVRSFCHERTWFPKRVQIERQFLSLLDPVEKNLQTMREFAPDVLYGYGSYVSVLFAHLHKTGASFHRPKAIVYSSDRLPDTARQIIAEDFGIPVFGWYQSVEAFRMGFECEEHVGLHLNMDLYPIRIADETGRTPAVGESGDVIVSNLVNRATVLLNYRLRDIASLSTEPCRCGRTLPLLSFPSGRTDDMIVLSSGQIIHPQAARLILIREVPMWEYQIIQRTPTYFDIVIVPVERCDLGAVSEQVAREFARQFGDEVTVNVSFVSTIKRTTAGKARAVISECHPLP